MITRTHKSGHKIKYQLDSNTVMYESTYVCGAVLGRRHICTDTWLRIIWKESSIPGGVEEQTSSAGLRSSPVKKKDKGSEECVAERKRMW